MDSVNGIGDNECLVDSMPDNVLDVIFRHVGGSKHALLASSRRFREVARWGIVLATTQAGRSSTVDLSRLVTTFPHLHALDVTWNQKMVVDVTPVGTLRRLRTLNLEGNSVTDFTPLASLSMLESLNIAWTGVSDMASLVALGKTLTRLDISGNRVMDMSQLSSLVALTELKMAANMSLDDDASPLATLTALRMLDISHTAIVRLPNLPSLISLVANDCIPSTAMASTLTDLDLGFTHASDSAPIAASMPDLQGLRIRCTAICDLSRLKTLRRLTVLTVCSTPDDHVLRSIAALTVLTALTVMRTSGDELLMLPVQLPSIRRFALVCGQITGASLLQMPHLTVLHLDWQLQLPLGLSGMTSLEELRLHSLRSTDLSPLSTLTRLRRLDMQRCVHADLSQLGMLTGLELTVAP
jgi:Leucine-rich repeat (LRR) protein